MKIEIEPKNNLLGKSLFLVFTFALNYFRNIFFLTSVIMIFLILAVIQIFFQDKLSINIFGQMYIALDNMPIIKEYIDINAEMHIDEKKITSFFLQLSLVFTTLTEVFYYFRKYVLKALPHKETWIDLKRRMISICIALTCIYLITSIYITWETGDVLEGVFVFILFWIITVNSSLLFLFFDFWGKKARATLGKL